MIELLTSRSRNLDYRRCNRSRWELHERSGTGFEPVRQAVPLVTGVGVHRGLGALLATRIGSSARFSAEEIDLGASIAVVDYEKSCKDRGLQLDELESQSYVFNEQRALVEALVRLGAMRVIPRLLETYEVLEVEEMDKRVLYTPPVSGWLRDVNNFRITWRSIPDALLRKRDDGQLYLLSWKTCGELPKDDEARVDMQGVSEAWGIQERLDNIYHKHADPADPIWGFVHDLAEPPKIRGVQMVYLVKGQRREGSADAMAQSGATKLYKTASPLIYGYQDQSFPPKLAWASKWKCSSPHPMRKSKWYPSGECPGDGRNHQRGDDWASFSVWDTIGVKAWMEMLDLGQVTPEAGDALDVQWTLPVPNFRTQEQIGDWLAQTRAQEIRIARDLLALRQLEEDAHARDLDPIALRDLLNESVLGPQSTDNCNRWFGRRCPAHSLCWGPDHVREDPVGSGLYQVKTQYEPEVEE